MEQEIHKPSFLQKRGNANEVTYWVFDYPPERELEVRERIQYMLHKNQRGVDGFELVVYDLYDLIIDYLEKMEFMEPCFRFEKTKGMERMSDDCIDPSLFSLNSLLSRNISEEWM